MIYIESNVIAENTNDDKSIGSNTQDNLPERNRLMHRVAIGRLFSPKILILLISCLFLNSAIASLVNSVGVPLYLDNIGSVLAAALGGPLVGIVVGFLSNVITTVSSSPISLYYGLITVANALIAAYFSCKGYLRSWKGAVALLPLLVFFGGFCGSLLTWVLYGGGIGGKGEKLAMFFFDRGVAALPSQLISDIIIDIVDKGITVFAVFIFLNHFPKKCAEWFPLSYIYVYSDEEIARIDKANMMPVRKNSLVGHTMFLTTLSLFVLSTILTFTSCLFYSKEVTDKYEMLVFIIQIVSVEFGIALIVITLLTWYLEHHITLPMSALVHQVMEFKQTDPGLWLESDFWKNRYIIDSGDELEVLYKSICEEEEKLSKTIVKLRNSHKKLSEAISLESQNRVLSLHLERVQAENEAKSEFYSRMNHDIRTPMNGIIGYTQLALSEDDPAAMRDELAKIDTCSRYLLRLINDVLDMSKLDADKFILDLKPFNLKKVLLELLDSVSISAQMKQLNLKTSCEDFNPDIYILADQLRFQQIFMNLTSNAVNYTPKGGNVYLIVRDRGSDGKTCKFRFIVRDTGVGMSEDFIKNHLFHPFSQEVNSESSKNSSTGLGLNIVKRLVDLMGGTISCESELGKGSTFMVDLNFKIIPFENTGIVEGTHRGKGNDDTSLLAGRNVLLCEDNLLNQEIAKRILENVNINVTVASNGKQGVDMFKDSKIGTFDAILMDVRMPVMDGITATRQIRALGRADASTVPIIAMTANAYKEDREETLRAGMNAHLAKPFDIRELYKILISFIA